MWSRFVHVLFPDHLRFRSGDTLFFLWLAWAEEGGIFWCATGLMFDLILSLPLENKDEVMVVLWTEWILTR